MLEFCILSDKCKGTYEKCISSRVRIFCEKFFTLKPKQIVIDFEIGIHTAIKNVWPGVRIIGCMFHLA